MEGGAIVGWVIGIHLLDDTQLSIWSHAALPAMAFGDPGSNGLTLHLTGGAVPVSMQCSTECFTFLKSGFSREGYFFINFM